jgi:hypothetical protein
MIASAVYVLCATTSMASAVLLWRGYRRSRSRLLLWSTLCFLGLTLQNAFLFVDFVIVPGVDLSIWRNASGVAGLAMLLFGLIWEVE